MGPGTVRLRRARTVVCYWRDGRLVFENYRTQVRITADPLATLVLDFFERWRSSSQFYARMSGYTRASLDRALRQLTQRGFLVREGSRQARHDAQFEKAWSPWLPAAGFLHFSTRNTLYTPDLAAFRRSLRRRAKKIPMPSPVKHYPRTRQLRLPAPRIDGEFPGVLMARRTWRRFSPRSVKLSTLATLLGLTWGAQHWMKLRGLGRVALKTSPSAGALHPIEVYVLALRVAGLPRGLYHYAADTHRLELLTRGASSRQAVSYLAGQWWYGSAAALMLMTAFFPRSQWKYQDPGAYRTVLLDAGHVGQTFCLVATWLGLAPFCTGALADSRVERALGVDGVTESVLYAAGVGTRPAGLDWASCGLESPL
jgi:SagB-type dehydrogenase family enzyme